MQTFSKIALPTPIAAGNPNSAHLIDICEFAPPNFVIKPPISWLKIKSKPGSALAMQTILPFKFFISFFENFTKSSETGLLPMKFILFDFSKKE